MQIFPYNLQNDLQAFFISNTLISNARLKFKQKLSNTLRLNILNLKIIRLLHPLYHPKILGDILKTYTKQVRVF